MKKLKKILTIALLLLINPLLFAQDAEMADVMRSEGKIYVVVAIILVIFLGLIGFLIFTDRKVSALEKRLNNLK
jgi:CcmD family protein